MNDEYKIIFNLIEFEKMESGKYSFIERQNEREKIEHSVEKYLIPSVIGNICECSDRLLVICEENMEKIDEGEYLKIMNTLRDIRRHIVSKRIINYPMYPLRIEEENKFEYSSILDIVSRMKHCKDVSTIDKTYSLECEIIFQIVFVVKELMEMRVRDVKSICVRYVVPIETKRKVIGGWKELVFNIYKGILISLKKECEVSNRDILVSKIETNERFGLILNSFNTNNDGFWEKTKKKILDIHTYNRMMPLLKSRENDLLLNTFTLIKNKKESIKMKENVYNVFHPFLNRENMCYVPLYESDDNVCGSAMNMRLSIIAKKC